MRSDIIDPLHASPFLSMTTSEGLNHGVGTGHSLICFVFGSSMAMALPSYSANHRRFRVSTLPLRGRELGIGVRTISSFLVVPLRIPMFPALKSSMYRLLLWSALIPYEPMVRFVSGSVNAPKFSHSFVAGSNLRICARSELLTQTLPSTCGKVGETKDCSVASVCHSFGTDQVCTLPVFLSNLATPP